MKNIKVTLTVNISAIIFVLLKGNKLIIKQNMLESPNLIVPEAEEAVPAISGSLVKSPAMQLLLINGTHPLNKTIAKIILTMERLKYKVTNKYNTDKSCIIMPTCNI
tara:strand:+ start:367 stop:687 length:321 start_codon:yes stop_codon:yes gene_type:complete